MSRGSRYEAFAVVPFAVLRELGWPKDIANVEAGAVLTTRILHSMKRDGLR